MAMATIYRRRKWSRPREILINQLDHIGIFLMIAGSMMPVAVLVLPESGSRLIMSLWTAAFFGSLHTLGLMHGGRGSQSFTAVIYVGVGGGSPRRCVVPPSR